MNLEKEAVPFIESLRLRGRSAATVASYRDSLKPFFAFLGKACVSELRAVTAETIRRYELWTRAQPWALRTRHTRLCALSTFFASLEKNGAVFMSPCRGLVLPKLGERLPRGVLTVTQARRVLRAPDLRRGSGVRDRALMEIFYSTGLRLGEVVRLTIADLDLRGLVVRVRQGKGAKDRVVPLGTTAAQWVQRYLATVRPAWSRCAAEPGAALWLGAKRPFAPLKAQAVYILVRACGRKAGVVLTPHIWRHTCATHLVANGANIVYVQKLLGHSSLETTQLYTRVAIPEVKRTHRRAHPGARVRVCGLRRKSPRKRYRKTHDNEF
jgi:integrase/recombinase XerD